MVDCRQMYRDAIPEFEADKIGALAGGLGFRPCENLLDNDEVSVQNRRLSTDDADPSPHPFSSGISTRK
jgi:hypothetical protein